jgi:hypothetical protein
MKGLLLIILFTSAGLALRIDRGHASKREISSPKNVGAINEGPFNLSADDFPERSVEELKAFDAMRHQQVHDTLDTEEDDFVAEEMLQVMYDDPCRAGLPWACYNAKIEKAIEIMWWYCKGGPWDECLKARQCDSLGPVLCAARDRDAA